MINFSRPLILLASFLAAVCAEAADTLRSPDGKIAVEFGLSAEGTPTYAVKRADAVVLEPSKLGVVRDDADFSKKLKAAGASKVTRVEDHYDLLTSKRRSHTYRANRQVLHFETADGRKMDVIFQVSNDGLAFRYFFPETSGTVRTIVEEITSFHFPAQTKAWLQPMAVAKSGWSATNPSYEEYYEQEIPVGKPSSLGAGWVYPALFRAGETWVVVSESALDRHYCGTRLRHASPNGEYSVGLADARETIGQEPVNPASALPWLTPWRVVALGTLKTIAESTLGTDVADQPAKGATPPMAAIRPGKSSWSWPLLGDGKTTFEVQKRFIEYAADMGWSYCLIDALWDTQIGYDRVKELADYARTKNVSLLLWYNSNGSWNQAPQTPKDRLLTHEARIREFERLKAMGIRGLKVDFFGGDGRPMINLYHDLLTDSAPYGLLMNFHGTTLPRGWQRTYPHLMTMEAIRGFEFITFEQANADRQPSHCAMLPFTRNVFDPMDFTPVCLDKLPHGTRRTTVGFELALSVLFTSGIQHYAEIPEGLAKTPDYVQQFLKRVPSIWTESLFIDGYPGKLAVMARKGDGRWYVAGINGEATEKTITLDLNALGNKRKGTLIADGAGGSFEKTEISWKKDSPPTVTLKPNGGFVIVIE